MFHGRIQWKQHRKTHLLTQRRGISKVVFTGYATGVASGGSGFRNGLEGNLVDGKLNTTPSDALQDLLNWSARLHTWQRHGLNCLAQGTLKNEDIADTLEHCRLAQDLPPGGSTFLTKPTKSPPEANLLSVGTLPRSDEVSAPVSLDRIESVKFVNALARDQTLSFAPEGLTVIYGDNASGKSGYARILKRACRAREREADLLPNVYESPPPPEEKPRATIHFRVGDDARHIDWVDGSAMSHELPFIQVFDSGCAAVQVTEKNDVIFTPFALELLTRLGGLCTIVKEQLLAERAVAEAKASRELDRNLKDLGSETEAGRAVAKLTHETDPAALRRLGSLTDGEQNRLRELQDTLSENPAKLAAEARKQRTLLQILTRSVSAARSTLSVDALTEIHGANSDYRAKSEASALAANTLFSEQPLPGVGSDTWRALWSSARAYSTTETYPKKPFPVTEEDTRRVLCQQPLGEEASKRLRAFEEFIQADTQRAEDEAKAKLHTLLQPIRTLELPGNTKSLPFSADDPLAYQARRFLVNSKRRRRAALWACSSGAWGAPLPELPNDPSAAITDRVTELDSRIDELERSAQSEERRKLESELEELVSRMTLASLLDDIEAEIDRLALVHRINEAIRTTDTTRISRKSTEIARSAVTNRIRDQFAQQLLRLGVHHARVELAHVATDHGTPQFKAQLLAEPTAKLGRILSEGEHTCVALAGFLAELAIAQHNSALVFDDPVSSLDHNWRRHVAVRLAEESKKRQVVVFTHDTVFLMALTESAGRQEVPLSVVHLERRTEVTGLVVDGAPWNTMRVKERIPYLRKKLSEAKPHWDNGESHIYEPLARDIYGLLREAWERGVEELLLNQVVLRFGRAVQTNRLKVLTDITDSDITTVDDAMTKCSTYMRGHDDAPAINESVPGLPELEDDLAHFETWVQLMRKRKRS